MSKIYISGKISGIPIDLAKSKFEDHANKVRLMGHEPISPFYNGLSDEDSWETHMRADLKMMLDCDIVHLLPCWQTSKGAIIERDLAKRVGIEVVYI